MKKIKIVIFADVLKENVDGVTHTLYNIINNIPKNRFEYLFITPYPPTEIDKFPFPIYVCNNISFIYQEYKFAVPFFDKKLSKKLNEFNPDLIHFTTPSLLGLYAVKYGNKNNIPILSTYHTHFITYVEYYFRLLPVMSQALTWLAKKISKWIYNKCEVTFVPTEPVMNDLIDAGVDKDKLMIWGRGIDSNLFSPDKKDHEYIDNLCGPNTKRILFVSRLVWIKEIKSLIGIYNYLQEHRPDVKMILTGDGTEQKTLMKKMPKAVFTGKLMGENLAKIYASADIFVFPSITETFGNVVLEAISSGLPVVVAAKGGPKGIVNHGVTGLHAKPKNVKDFTKKINYLLDNPSHAKDISKNAVAYAKTQTWENLCDEMFLTYENIHFQKTNNKKPVEIAV